LYCETSIVGDGVAAAFLKKFFEAKFGRNMGKTEAKFGQKELRFGKI